MENVSVHEAKTHLSRLLKQVAEGKEFIITSSGKPVAKISACNEMPKRIFGLLKGQISIPKDFDAPMPEEWFEGQQ